jgi:hypothetical protein
MQSWLRFGWVLALMAACEVEYPAADAGSDAGSAADAAALLACGADPFPSIDRGCQVDQDCVAVEHQINCCGTLRAIGVRAAAKAAFDAAEASCRSAYPLCDCASQVTQADDGTSAAGAQAAAVRCADGSCRTSFPPPDPGVCTPGGEPCPAGFSCCYPCGIPDCEFRCEPTCDPGSPGCAGGCFLRP